MNIYSQGRLKQIPNGQAQLDVGGEAVKKFARKVRGKILDLAIFSSQEVLPLHFGFKPRV